MASLLRFHVSNIQIPVSVTRITKQTFRRASVIRCGATTPKKPYTIAVLPGDGVVNIDKGETVRRCSSRSCWMPKWDNNPKHLKPITALLQLRVALEVFANLRPIKVLPQLIDSTYLRKDAVEGVDLFIIRELTGGIYNAHPCGFTTNEQGDEVGFCTESYSASEVDHIARVAFDIAKQRRGKLCSADKATVLEGSMLWRKRVTTVSSQYPEVEVSHLLIDNAAMDLVRHPRQFDTILTVVMFGDILSDLAAMIPESVGLLPSDALGDSDAVNPMAAVLSAAMLFRYGFWTDIGRLQENGRGNTKIP